MNTSKIRSKQTTVNYEDNLLSVYLKDINKVPLLSREDEEKYARLAAKGDKKAKEILINSNLRFVVNVAKKFQNQGLPLSDLISEGNIGLMNAVDRFDVEKGYHFISYAVWWIRQSILKAICEKSRMIRLPLNRANELVQIEKARKFIQGGKSDSDEIQEIADMMHMDANHVAEIVNISRDLISLESPVYSEKDSSVLGDFIEDSGYKTPEYNAIEQNLKNDINEILTDLSFKESEIIQYRFGLNGKKQMSLKEIGDKFNLTKERIRQIEKKALKRLQQPSRMSVLEAYVA